MKYVIVGGVAAGASAAARLRRLDERAEIVLLERGDSISYANCGIPYHLGGVIAERGALSVMPPAKFRAWFNVDARTGSEVTAIDRAGKTVTVKGEGGEYKENYDKLLLATGSSPADLGLPGADGARVHRLWTLGDMDRVMSALDAGAKKAIVAGAGAIGLETAENLRRRGLEVVLAEGAGHVLPAFDAEMTAPLHAELEKEGIRVEYGKRIAKFEEKDGALEVTFGDGSVERTDFALVAAGVRPNSELAREAGLECTERGAIKVDAELRTSDPDIYAAGDAAEVGEAAEWLQGAVPLAGPANRQGRIAAGNMAGGSGKYIGGTGASVVKVGGLTAAAVGRSAERLAREGVAFRRVYLHPAGSAAYYPGAVKMHVKLLFGEDGKVLGAQITGGAGVEKLADGVSQAIRFGLTVRDLAESECAYAPPCNTAKAPVNYAGFAACNVLDGLSDACCADEMPKGAAVLDVREPAECAAGMIPGAVNIPLGQLRGRLGELDRGKPVVVHCQVGLRGYLAERILKQNGFMAMNLSGGYLTWKAFRTAERFAAGTR